MAGDLGAYWRSVVRGGRFRVRAVARGPRGEAITRIEDAIQRHGGDLLDFKMFSNLSVNLNVEMDAGAVPGLLDEVGALGWTVEVDPSREVLAAGAGQRREGTVQLTFPEGDGELVITVPAVPG